MFYTKLFDFKERIRWYPRPTPI